MRVWEKKRVKELGKEKNEGVHRISWRGKFQRVINFSFNGN